MGTKAVLINTPKNTVQSDAHDWASIFNSIIGDVSGVLDYGKKLELKKINDNTVQLQDGVYSMQGHIIKVDKNTTQNLTITSGTLGMNRLDAVVVEYEKAADHKENDTFEFKVIRGTPVNEGGSSPVLPQLIKGDLLAGGSKRQELLYLVLVENTIISKISKGFSNLTNLNGLDLAAKSQDVKLDKISYELIKTAKSTTKKYSNGLIEMKFSADISVSTGNRTVFANLPHQIIDQKNAVLLVQKRSGYNDFKDVLIYGSSFSGQTVAIALNNKTGTTTTETFYIIVSANWK